MPEGAFYAFPNITGTGLHSKELADRLLTEAGVACLSGTSFGEHGEGYLRFSYANSREKISAAKFKTPIDDTVKAFKADPDIRSASSPLASGSSGQLSKNESIGYVALNLRPSSSDLTLDDANRIVALADPARHAGLP